jgi:tRNA(Ile)-lysidine synthase
MFNVPYAIDKTNLEDHFLRNQIRHSIVEKLSPLERKDILSEIDQANEKLSQIFITISKINDNKIDSYLRLNDVEFLYAIVALGRKLKPDFIVSKKQGEELRKVLESNKPNIALNVDGLCFFKEYDVLGFREFDENLDYFYDMVEPGILDTPYFFLDFTVDSSNRNVKEDDYPLVIRNAQ